MSRYGVCAWTEYEGPIGGLHDLIAICETKDEAYQLTDKLNPIRTKKTRPDIV